MTGHSTPDDDVPADVVDRYFARAMASVRASWRARPKRWAICVLAVLVLVAGWLVWPWDWGEDEAEIQVREYLEAIRAADLDSAEEKLYRPPASNTRQLLDPAALNSDWAIESISRKDAGEDPASAEVDVVISSSAEKAAFEFKLKRPPDVDSESPFRILNGVVELVPASTGVWDGLRVNGQLLQWEDEEIPGQHMVPLFPGVYDFGHAFEDYIDADFQERLLTGEQPSVQVTGEDADESAPSPEPLRFNEDGDAEAQEALESHIDDCVTEPVGIVRGCPFGVDDVAAPGLPYTPNSEELNDAKWEVEEYPQVTVVEEDGFFQFEDSGPGTVRLIATVESDGVTADIDMECEIRTSNLSIGVGSDEQIEVTPGNRAYAGMLDNSAGWWHTCP